MLRDQLKQTQEVIMSSQSQTSRKSFQGSNSQVVMESQSSQQAAAGGSQSDSGRLSGQHKPVRQSPGRGPRDSIKSEAKDVRSLESAKPM